MFAWTLTSKPRQVIGDLYSLHVPLILSFSTVFEQHILQTMFFFHCPELQTGFLLSWRGGAADDETT